MRKNSEEIKNKKDENIFNVKIEELNINGEGVSFLEDKTKVCVKNVLSNETVEVKSVFKKNNFIKAEVLKILNPSDNRIIAPCKYYGCCGGCNYQHINNKKALELKKQIFEKYFEDVYNNQIEVFDNNNPFEYRNKASFVVKNSKVGFQREGTNDLIEIGKCLIVKPEINKVLTIFKNWINKTKDKNINHIVIRVLKNKILLTIVCVAIVNNLNLLIDSLKKEFKENDFGVYLNFNSSKHKILSDNYKHIYGIKLLEDDFEGIKYNIHPNSFMQINDEIRDILYKNVQSEIDGEVVIEGYSGAGLLSSILCKKAKKVIGVEINKNATANANKLKKENNLQNLENLNGDCKKLLPILAKQYNNATFVIDPPRSGCDQNTLQALKDNDISKVVYVSCNPYTLKQNIKFLESKFYVEKIKMFNMFPNTSEIETLAVLLKK